MLSEGAGATGISGKNGGSEARRSSNISVASVAPQEDGETFMMRGLRSDDEVAAWGALCGAGFSHRPGDPDRFRKKYLYDPTASLELTRVAVPSDDDSRLAGTVRLFRRKWTTGRGGQTCGMIGLGEVCTHPDFRGKGIASLLMKDASLWCENAAEAGQADAPIAYISTLHAAASVGPLYAKYGYQSLLSIAYGRLAMKEVFEAEGAADIQGTQGPLGLVASPATVEESFDWSSNWEQLRDVHSSLCSHLEVVGCTVRDKDYWLRWMPNVTGNRMVVFVDGEDKSKIKAYAAFARKNDHYRLADAGMTKEVASNAEAAAFVLQTAALYALQADLRDAKIASAEALKEDAACLAGGAIPSLLVSLATPSGAASGGNFAANHAAFNDEGWMGKPLLVSKDRAVVGADKKTPSEEAVAMLQEAASRGKLLIFLADSF